MLARLKFPVTFNLIVLLLSSKRHAQGVVVAMSEGPTTSETKVLGVGATGGLAHSENLDPFGGTTAESSESFDMLPLAHPKHAPSAGSVPFRCICAATSMR